MDILAFAHLSQTIPIARNKITLRIMLNEHFRREKLYHQLY